MSSATPPTMDAKALAETSKQLSKAHDGGDPPSTLLSLLQPLEKFRATEDLLRQSKIGIAVAKLRGNKDPKVAQMASGLINKWKSDVKSVKPNKTGGGGGGTPGKSGASLSVNGVDESARSATGSPAPKPTSKEEKEPPAPKKYSAAPDKRTAKEDGVDTALTGNPTRDGCLTLIYNGLCYLSTASPDDILTTTRRVEAAAYEAYKPETSQAYKQKVRSLHLNLKMKQNEALRQGVLSGVIEAERFVRMSSDELKSEEMRRKDRELEKENMSKAMTAQEEKAISTTMQCGKCKQSRVAYSQAQTRSADEPMTTFCECTVCGHRWKFS